MRTVSCRERAAFAQANGYPRYSKEADSLANDPKKSGVQRVPQLEKLFQEEYGGAKVVNRKDNHKLQSRVQARITENENSAIDKRMNLLGFATRQEWLGNLIRKDLNNSYSANYAPTNSTNECSCGKWKDAYHYCCTDCRTQALNSLTALADALNDGQREFLDMAIEGESFFNLNEIKRRYE